MHPILTWALRVLRAAELALLLCFVAYFVSVQVNAIAYLTGRHRPIVVGTAPPVPLDSNLSAAGDITAGPAFEAIAALIFFIVVTWSWSVIRRQCKRQRPDVPMAHNNAGPRARRGRLLEPGGLLQGARSGRVARHRVLADPGR